MICILFSSMDYCSKFFLFFFLPGTLLSIIGILFGCKTEHDSKRKSSLISLLAALLQLITAPIIVGWIWSVLWGITFVNISSECTHNIFCTHLPLTNPLPKMQLIQCEMSDYLFYLKGSSIMIVPNTYHVPDIVK